MDKILVFNRSWKYLLTAWTLTNQPLQEEQIELESQEKTEIKKESIEEEKIEERWALMGYISAKLEKIAGSFQIFSRQLHITVGENTVALANWLKVADRYSLQIESCRR